MIYQKGSLKFAKSQLHIDLQRGQQNFHRLLNMDSSECEVL
jgi:hypothetical protein